MYKNKKKIFFIIVFISIVAVTIGFCYSLFVGPITFGSIASSDEIWDGNSVSTSFSAGNGSIDNPYQIRSGADLLFFKNLIESDDSNVYKNKYYKLVKNIDMGNNSFTTIGTKDNYFKGFLDGDGYTILNLKINGYSMIDTADYYSLFYKTEEATIENINLYNYNITTNASTNTVKVGSLVGEAIKTNIKNISFQNSMFDFTNISNTNYIGGIVNDLGEGSSIKNVATSFKITSNNILNVGSVSYSVESDINPSISNVITNIKYNNLLVANNSFYILNDNSVTKNLYDYTVDNGIVFSDTNVSSDYILNLFNRNSNYTWLIDENIFKLDKNENIINNENIASNNRLMKSRALVNFSSHESGIFDNYVYVNDLDADYNYYIGKNYSDSSDGKIPTTENKNIYNSSNLVKVNANYKGEDINDSNKIGYVSLTERQNNYSYYNYYYVEDGYITINLIDNPFTDRPDDMGFNGWVTDYEGAIISFDSNFYERKVKIPVSYTNGVPDDIVINFNASWIDATVYNITSTSNSWNNAFNNLNEVGMQEVYGRTPIYEDMRNYFIYGGTVSFYSRYPSNSYGTNGSSVSNNRCYSWDGCPYYTKGESTYDSGLTYYRVSNGSMIEYTPNITGYDFIDLLPVGSKASGLYREVTINRNSSISGYYNELGEYQSSGTCSSNSCIYYELVQYYDSNGNVEVINDSGKYYYLVTRDTNIIVMRANTTNSWTSAQASKKPFTLTSVHNGNDYTNYYLNVNSLNIHAYNDMVIENLYVYTTQDSANSGNPSNANNTSRTIYGDYNNLKIGRGLKKNSNYVNFISFIGGSNRSSGSSTNTTKYKLIVESGYYSYGATNTGNISTSYTTYTEGKAIYGSDYDRIDEDNSKFTLTESLATAWGGYNYSSSNIAVMNDTVYKSGTYGSRKGTNVSGIYFGQRAGGYSYALRSGKIEGGWYYAINGGPCVADEMQQYNSAHLYITGGEITMLFGGAGRDTSNGNRLITMTGGKVDYSVFGGSNAYSSTSGAGTIYGSSYVYIGGNAIVGDEALVKNNTKLFNSEAGSVFGHGNGGNNSTVVGSNDNSTVIIDGNATINGNVYGGSNNGLAGSTNSSGKTNIVMKVNGGTINGSLYGGGNNNGVGSTTVEADLNIDINNGVIKGSVFGGTRTKGIIYGSSTVNVVGGTLSTDVYGGGEGGYKSDSQPGTFIQDNITVNIGNTESGPTIDGNVYGGSAFGTVNSTTKDPTKNDKAVTVNINNGIIKGSTFGGAKGSSTYIPYIAGNIIVNINGGNIGNVFGGCNAAGVPKNEIDMYINGGTIGDVYGGGNETSINKSSIYVYGDSTIINDIFGGSKEKGNAANTNLFIKRGTINNVYGGNNQGGTTEVSHLNIFSEEIYTHIYQATINGNIYGGGKFANTGISNINLQDATLNTVYGGGENSSVTTTNITSNASTVQNIYGGSNIKGDVDNSIITINKGTYGSIYGGNNEGGTTKVTNISHQGGTTTNLYGGGNKTLTDDSNVVVVDGIVANLYGGGNQAGVNETNVNILSGSVFNAYGGSNQNGTVKKSNIKTTGNNQVNDSDIDFNVTYIAEDVTWQSSSYPTIVTINYEITNNSSNELTAWNASIYAEKSVIFSNYSQSNIYENDSFYSINEVNRYYGVNTISPGGSYTISFSILTMQDKDSFKFNYGLSGSDGENQFVSGSSTMIGNLYGGNNEGGFTEDANVEINAGFTGDIYGGGDIANVSATNVIINGGSINGVYGGSNRSSILTDTKVTTTGGTIVTDIYGGGNEGVVLGNTDVNVLNTTILGSVYAGGNGTTAVVQKNSNVTIQGDTIIGNESSIAPESGCLFGSGKAAATGNSSTNDSIATVNLVGGTIYGNVYGGANTSVVYGKADINIGTNVVDNKDLLEHNIKVYGTVFGGGEANASGSENYDFLFISVTKQISIDIDGKNYSTNNHDFNLYGSIFGSGNASSSSGISEIYVSNLGNKALPSKNISIQRCDVVTIDNSVIELSGTTDRTNEYSTIDYSLNRINKLKLKNNSILLLKENANMLKELDSVVDKDGEEVKATVSIDKNNKTVTRNVDNRIYMLLNKNLNVTTNEVATSYGKISGMTFFGMYVNYNNGSTSFGVYDNSLDYGDTADAGDFLNGGSYILGLHNTNHNIEEDGFYTNSLNDDYTEVVTDYINPTPSNSSYYLWTIGVESINYSFKLTASKYSSLGTYELSLRDFADGDTTFEVLGFNSEGLTSGVNLVDSNNVPKVADSEEEANKTLGLSMKSETTEWTSHETTKLLSKNNGTYTGSNKYKTDSQESAPSLMFYLYHAKDITLDQQLGSVVLTLEALVPKNEIEYDIQLITITIELEAKSYDDGDCYDASITYNKKYEMPSATAVNITNKSQFTAYYSLYTRAQSFENFYGRNNENYHVLTTNRVLPVGTMITMMDYGGKDSSPTYYYYIVDQASYNNAVNQLQSENEVTYRLSDFVKMGSSSGNNKFSDQEANRKYFDYNWSPSGFKVSEEFVFIFDFKNADTSGDYLNNNILFELRNSEDRALISVLGIRQNLMNYNLYETSNIVLKETANFTNTNIYRNTFNMINYSTQVDYDRTSARDQIIDTNYESIGMGLNVLLYDNSGNQVSSSNLQGTILKINNVSYYVDSDGVFRIKLSNKVSNIVRNITLLTDNNLASGSYKMKFVLFASNDGLHNDGSLKDSIIEVPIIVVGNDNLLKVTSNDKTKVVDKDTSLNMLDEDSNIYTINYSSNLSNPNIRLSLMKRNTTSSIDNNYTEIDLSNLFINSLAFPDGSLTKSSENELLITRSPKKTNELSLKLNDNLKTGTYKLVFKLYDGNHLVDDDIEYVIVKKGQK